MADPLSSNRDRSRIPTTTKKTITIARTNTRKTSLTVTDPELISRSFSMN